MSKPSVDIIGITVSMWESIILKPFSLLMMLWILNMEFSNDLGLDKKAYSMKLYIYFGPKRENWPHATLNHGPGKSKFEVYYYRETYFSTEKVARIRKIY